MRGSMHLKPAINEIVPPCSHPVSETACSFRVMRSEASAPASILPLLRRWRSSLPHAEPPCLAQSLRTEAQRCYRLARGIASFELADELEAIGRAFESEAVELETRRVLSVQAAGRAA